jgi:hypothetical protein
MQDAAAPPPAGEASVTRNHTAAAAAAAADIPPPYLAGAPDSFLKQADVLFLAAERQELPAHSQFLARSCALFAELLDPEAGVAQQPSAAAPLVVPVQRWRAEEVEQALAAVYQPHLAARLAASLHTAAAYGAQLDLAAYLRCVRRRVVFCLFAEGSQECGGSQELHALAARQIDPVVPPTVVLAAANG